MTVSVFGGLGNSAAIANISDKIEKLQTQTASNSKYGSNLEMQQAGELVRFTDTVKLAAAAQQDKASMHPLQLFAQEQAEAVKQMHDMSVTLQEFTASNPEPDLDARQAKATEMLTQLNEILNKKASNGEFLFGGVSSGASPVTDITVTNLDGGGHPTTLYYTGSSAAQTYDVAGNNVRFTVNASNEGVRDLIGALHMLNTNGTDMLNVQEMAKQSTNELNIAQERGIKNVTFQLQTIEEHLENEIARLEDQKNSITELDTAGIMKLQQELNDAQMHKTLIAMLNNKIKHLWEMV